MVVGSGTQNKTVAVVGAGLVGALEACVMAQRGYKVNLYEFRKDIRTLEHVPGRSINLAMSVRGRSALRKVGVEGDIIERHAIPMKARMIHGTDGTMNPIPYNKDGQCIYSVGRRFVNEVLLTKAESFPNVTCHFEHQLTSINLDERRMIFTNPSSKERTEVTADLIIGCDGAYSAVRKEMLKRPQFNYSQQYIPHGYMELCIPPNSNGEFAMPANYLHIWPRGNFMMIALPNQDRSWTVTLFMPFPIFDSLNSPAKLIEFFTRYYPDSIPLIGREKLIKDFFANKALPMITVKCSPYHVGGSCVILGDAAHAMVPFYGQGMNCGMEDCLVLDEILTQHSEDLNAALPAYSVKRNPDAEAIVDLAMYNYVEMRDLVNSRLFLIRKKIDNALNVVFPRSWVPLYTMVTFSREPYHSCILKKRWQDKVLRLASVAAVGTTAGVVAVVIRRNQPSQPLDTLFTAASQALSVLNKTLGHFSS
ncbi:kynurenine 3-monooxygenase [Hyalella azteca]|uniref:Kynurenine 3-monooxygenase n=1 Tax=Hyalella azteca TaxID=294128 RepID=A0A979FJC1_HYAAZ|nr:kynurenine 3-monooxygenase [Hyalella azteca]